MDAFLQDLLALASKHCVGLRDLLTSVVGRAVAISTSQTCVLILSPSFDGPSSPPPPPDRASRTDEFDQLSSRVKDQMRKVVDDNKSSNGLAYSTSSGYTSDLQRIFDLVANSHSSICLPLKDGYEQLGWIGLGAERDAAYTRHTVDLLQKVLESAALTINRLLLHEHSKKRGIEVSLIGGSEPILRLERTIKQAACHNHAPILIRGERGSGKELVAYAIHFFSNRRDEAFVPSLTSAFADSMQIDELFGHEKSAFTGAVAARKGKFQAAAGGTIFLDEIADLCPELQIAMLRVLEQGEIQPIGRDLPIKVNVRVVTSTNKDLAKLVDQGHFRADLYDRLNVIELKVPPLRERKEDIPLLAEYFILKQCIEISRQYKLSEKPICQVCERTSRVGCATEAFYGALQAYDWPGNVRELANLITQLSTMATEEVLDIGHLPEHILKGGKSEIAFSSFSEDLRLDAAVQRHIERVLALTEGNQTQAAKILGVPRTTLQAKLRRMNRKVHLQSPVSRRQAAPDRELKNTRFGV